MYYDPSLIRNSAGAIRTLEEIVSEAKDRRAPCRDNILKWGLIVMDLTNLLGIVMHRCRQS